VARVRLTDAPGRVIAPIPSWNGSPEAVAYPEHLIEAWQVDDDTPVTIRPIHPRDTGMELAFIAGLSSQTRYQRVLSARKLLPGELRRLTHIDYRRDMALVATAWIDGLETQLGVVRYVRLTDTRSAEFAIVIGDRWQRRGLGAKLLLSLLEVASQHGLLCLTGITLSTNVRMLALARRAGFTLQLDRGDATVTNLHRLLGAARERAVEGLSA
jgi:RimJ/RimL family protein N-acetyltransferase